MKFLVPVARISLEDCQRMADIFAQYHCDTREAGQLYTAWRYRGRPRSANASSMLAGSVFQDAAAGGSESRPEATGAELFRDLEMVARDREPRATAAGRGRKPRSSWIASNATPRDSRSSAFKSNLSASTNNSYRRRNRMLSLAQRTTILELNAKQVSKREIARGAGDLPRGGYAKSCGRTPPQCRSCSVRRKPTPIGNRSWSFSTSARGISCESMRSWWPRVRSCRMPR